MGLAAFPPWKASPRAAPNRSRTLRCHPVCFIDPFLLYFSGSWAAFTCQGCRCPGRWWTGNLAVEQQRSGWGRFGVRCAYKGNNARAFGFKGNNLCAFGFKGNNVRAFGFKASPEWSAVIPWGKRVLPVPRPSTCPVLTPHGPPAVPVCTYPVVPGVPVPSQCGPSAVLVRLGPFPSTDPAPAAAPGPAPRLRVAPPPLCHRQRRGGDEPRRTAPSQPLDQSPPEGGRPRRQSSRPVGGRPAAAQSRRRAEAWLGGGGGRGRRRGRGMEERPRRR